MPLSSSRFSRVAKTSFFDAKKLRIIGHRGAAGMAPENTFVSFDKAITDGADFIEMDLRESKDGEILIFHDATLERTTNGQGEVQQLSLKELQNFDAGYWFTPDGGQTFPFRGRKITIPTLEEFFTTFPKVKATVELKEARPVFIERLVASIKQFRKEEMILLATVKDEVMTEIRRQICEQDLTIATGFSYGEAAAFLNWVWDQNSSSFAPAGEALQVPCEYEGLRLITELTLKAAHELGIEVHAWTINEVEEMVQLIQLGVDGVVSDYPARLRELRIPNQDSENKVPSRAIPN